MRIQICPIKRLYQILAETGTVKAGAVLSSSSDINDAKLQGISYVFRQYEDLDYESPGRSFSREDAKAFADFLTEQETPIDTLYCCCDAGESRSPAVAAAVMRYLGMDDMAIWQNPRYHPNMLVFDMFTQALGVAIDDTRKDDLFQTNRTAFSKAIKQVRGDKHG